MRVSLLLIVAISLIPAALAAPLAFISPANGATGVPPPPAIALNIAAPELLSPANGATGVPFPPTIVWAKVDGAQKYAYWAEGPTATGMNIWSGEVTATDAAEQSHTFPEAQIGPNREVRWQVRAIAADGTAGDWSGVFVFHTAGVAAPTLALPVNGATKVSLTPQLVWKRTAGAVSYSFQANTTNNFSSPRWTDEVTGTSSDDQTLTFSPGLLGFDMDVFWRVRAVATGGIPGDWSGTFSFRTRSEPMATPTLVSPANEATNIPMAARLVWRKVSGAVKYKYLVSTSETTKFGEVTATSADEQFFTLPAGTASHSTEVSWAVQAVAADGTEGPVSDLWKFTTEPVILPQFSRPVASDVFMPGRGETISWTGGNVERIDVFYQDEESTDAVAIVLNFAGGSVTWTAPEEMTCLRCRIAIRRAGDATNNPVRLSDRFVIRGIHLKRRTAEGADEYFMPDLHGWRFANTAQNLFPEAWWRLDQFNYGRGKSVGRDILPGNFYPKDFSSSKDFPTNSAFFPDWQSFVDAFGAHSAYDRLNPAGVSIYNASFFTFWRARHIAGGNWAGSCSGMSSLALLMFHDASALSSLLGIHNRLYDFNPNHTDDPNARTLINARQQYWSGLRQRNHVTRNFSKTPIQTFADVQAMLQSEASSDDGYLYISSARGAHAVVPYRITDDARNTQWKRVYVYDPNDPGDRTAFVLFQLDVNRWSYTGFSPAWTGTGTGVYLMDPVANYHGHAELPWSTGASKSAEDFLEVIPPAGTSIRVEGADGTIGFADGEAYSTIEGAIPLIPPVGGAMHPTSYQLPNGNYSLVLTDFADSTAFLSVVADDVWYTYGRSDAEGGQRDELAFDEHGLTMRNEDPADKELSLETHAPQGSRSLIVSDLVLRQSETVKVSAAEGDALRIENMGAAKSYTLELKQAGLESAFIKARIVLESGSSHTIVPDWQDLETVPVEVDQDGDGQMDASFELVSNRAPGEAVITQPLSDVHIGGEPATLFIVEWQAAEDLDGDTLVYRWELSQSVEFDEPLISRSAGAETRLEFDFGTIGTLLTSAGVATGASVPLYHRVLASDGLAETASATIPVTFTRGALTSVERAELPFAVVLDQNYPNPFNPSTVISYGLPSAGAVRLEVFDLLGRRVRMLVDATQPAGWHQIAFDAGDLPSGIYLYRLTAGEVVTVRRLLLAK